MEPTMHKHTHFYIYKGALYAIILAIPFVMDAIGEPFMTNTFTRIMIYALAAVSLDFILGYGGMVSLGHAVFFGIGGYVMGILSYHHYDGTPIFGFTSSESILYAILFAIVISGIFALITGMMILRTKGAYFIMITLAFAQLVYYLSISVTKYGADEGLILYGRGSLFGLDLYNDKVFYYLCAFILMVFVCIYGVIAKSKFGLMLRGSMINDARLTSLGGNPYAYKLTAYVLSSMGASVAGVLLANMNEFISPDALHWIISGDLMIMVILGGVGTLYGAILGAFIFIGFEQMFPFLLAEFGFKNISHYWRLLFAPLLIAIVLYSNRGIIGIYKNRKKR